MGASYRPWGSALPGTREQARGRPRRIVPTNVSPRRSVSPRSLPEACAPQCPARSARAGDEPRPDSRGPRDGLAVLGVEGADGAHDPRQRFLVAVGEPGATNLVLAPAS